MNNQTPLSLPSTGDQVIEGRQYILDKYARRAVREEFGLQPPQVVTALYKSHHAERVVTTIEDLVTHEVRTIKEDRPEVQATFYWFTGTHRVRFVLSLESLAEVRAMNAETDKASDNALESKSETRVKVSTSSKKNKMLSDVLKTLLADL